MDEILLNYNSPAYIFDIDVLKKRIYFMKDHLSNISLCYAIKANPFIVKEVESEVERIEVCSPGEYYICKENGIDERKIVISGVYKTPEVIEKMMIDSKNIGVYTVESLQQLYLLDQLSQKHQLHIQVLLRLTSGNQFGIDTMDIENIVKQKYEYINIVGIQYFSGTQKTSLKKLKREIQELDQFLLHLKKDYQFEALELEYGTGFPVQYFETEKTFNEVEFFQSFNQYMNEMQFQGKKIIEVGRSIAASCGSYLTRIVDIKTNKKQNYAIVDGGMHQLVYYGQMMAMKHPKYDIYPYREHSSDEAWNICGSLCSVNDIIVKNVMITDLKIGDILIFKNTGAYCMMEGISLFLSRDLPRIILLKDNQYHIIRNTIETYQFNM